MSKPLPQLLSKIALSCVLAAGTISAIPLDQALANQLSQPVETSASATPDSNASVVEAVSETHTSDEADPMARMAVVEPVENPREVGVFNEESQVDMNVVGRYDSGLVNEDGGTTEIVAFSDATQKAYVVIGESASLAVIDASAMANSPGTVSNIENADVELVDVNELITTQDPAFEYGDLTSVAVSSSGTLVALSVQAKDYSAQGYLAILDQALSLVNLLKVGMQPDMVTFSPDERYILVANEGEPRMGYDPSVVDPKGSVSVIDLALGAAHATVTDVDFSSFDLSREELVASGVIVQKGLMPSTDFEPEYIAVSPDSTKAYIALQEANAIARLDLETKTYDWISSLGFKDFNHYKIDLMKDGVINLENQNVFGIPMPDAIAIFVGEDGKTYLVSANEGDSRDWDKGPVPFINELEVDMNGNEVLIFDTSLVDGLNQATTYIFGARSFSIYDAETMELIYDSGSIIEQITADVFPDNFNASNTKRKLDNRSGKKGPEVESVVTGTINGRTYAFVGLERISGVMVLDVTNPHEVSFVNYLNSRNFNKNISGDVSPEGLAFARSITSEDGSEAPGLFVAHEVSGTVTLISLLQNLQASNPAFASEPTLGYAMGLVAALKSEVPESPLASIDQAQSKTLQDNNILAVNKIQKSELAKTGDVQLSLLPIQAGLLALFGALVLRLKRTLN